MRVQEFHRRLRKLRWREFLGIHCACSSSCCLARNAAKSQSDTPSQRFPAAITANGGTKANQKRKAIVWDQLDLDGAVADAANLRMPTPTPAPAAKPKVEVTPLVPHKAGGSKEIVTRSKRSATMEQVKTEEVVDDEPIATRRVRRKVVAAKDEAA